MSNKGNGRGSDGYEVGKGRPPKKSQWKKGQSGNPKGRKKGRRNVATIAREILNGPMLIRENGVERQVSLQEAYLRSLAAKTFQGSAKDSIAAWNALRALAPEEPEDAPEVPPRVITVRYIQSDGDGAPAPGQGQLAWEKPYPVNATRAEMMAYKAECYAEAARHAAAAGEGGYHTYRTEWAKKAKEKREDNDLNSNTDQNVDKDVDKDAEDDSWLD